MTKHKYLIELLFVNHISQEKSESSRLSLIDLSKNSWQLQNESRETQFGFTCSTNFQPRRHSLRLGKPCLDRHFYDVYSNLSEIVQKNAEAARKWHFLKTRLVVSIIGSVAIILAALVIKNTEFSHRNNRVFPWKKKKCTEK